MHLENAQALNNVQRTGLQYAYTVICWQAYITINCQVDEEYHF